MVNTFLVSTIGERYISPPSITLSLQFPYILTSFKANSYITMSESESAIARVPYHIQSKNTKSYVISLAQDKAGQEVDTKPGEHHIPPHAVRAQSLLLIQASLTLWSDCNSQSSYSGTGHYQCPHPGSQWLICRAQGQSTFINYINCGLTNTGLRMRKRTPSSFGSRSNTSGMSV